MGYLAEISELRLAGSPGPGDAVTLEARLTETFGTAHMFAVRASSEDRALVERSLVIAV